MPEVVFATAFLAILALGAIQVALTLYARNVVISSAHEGARAALEIGRDETDAARVARSVVARSTGSLTEGLTVSASLTTVAETRYARVQVRAVLRPPGPLPVSLPLTVVSSAASQGAPR